MALRASWPTRAAHVAFGVVLATAGVGCSLLLADDGIVGGRRVAPEDASGRGDDAGDASPGRGDARAACATSDPAVVFCDDFDQQDLAQTWGPSFEQGAQVTRSDAAYVSAPYSLQAASLSASPGGATLAYVKKTFDAFAHKPLRASIDVEVFVKELAPRAIAVVATLQIRSGDDMAQFQIAVSNLEEAISLYAAEEILVGSAEHFFEHPTHAPLALGRWTHVRLDLTVASFAADTANRIALTVDQVPVFEEPVRSAVVAGSPEIAVGAVWVSKSAGRVVVAEDDVVLRIE